MIAPVSSNSFSQCELLAVDLHYCRVELAFRRFINFTTNDKLVVFFYCNLKTVNERLGMPATMSEILENPVEGWVTMKEAGKIVNRETATIRYWANTGKIASFNVGSSPIRIVNVEQVKEYSEKHSYRLPPEKRGRLKKSE